MHRPLFILFASIVLLAASGDVNDDLKAFSWLKRQHVMYISDYGEVAVLYNPEFTKIIDRDREFEEGMVDKVIMQTRLDASSNDIYEISFFEGEAGDATFSINNLESGTNVARILATTLIVPGNGYVYSLGHVFSHFDVHSKYKLESGSLVEVRQPFYYVGMVTETLADIDIFSAQDGGEIVAHLPKGSKIEVLVGNKGYYLIKTTFGLVGWYKYNIENPYQSSIRGFYLYGE